MMETCKKTIGPDELIEEIADGILMDYEDGKLSVKDLAYKVAHLSVLSDIQHEAFLTEKQGREDLAERIGALAERLSYRSE
jgi:hypothetical protein